MKEERKLTSLNLALVLVHDLLLARGIQAGDGPIKQAVLRHKTRLHGEFQKLKIKRGVKSNLELAQSADERAGEVLFRLRSVVNNSELNSANSPLCPSEYIVGLHRRRRQIISLGRLYFDWAIRIQVPSFVFIPMTAILIENLQ